MTPEDTNKIVAAIDRNTAEIKLTGSWLFVALMLVVMFLAIGIKANATPILITTEPIVEIGTPPLPPPNPHVQYWHTQWVPMDGGVYPHEVYAPALPKVEPAPYVFVDIGDSPRLVETPEPGTWVSVLIGIIGGIAISTWARKAKVKRRRLLLEAIRKLEPNASTLAIGREIAGEFHPGWIYLELDSMREEGMLIMWSTAGGPERRFRDRVFYSIARKET